MWAITPEERGKHDKQFDSLAPVLGYVSGRLLSKQVYPGRFSEEPLPVWLQLHHLSVCVSRSSGEQARKFFLQSGLPPSVLAEIW